MATKLSLMKLDELYGNTPREASILFQSTNGPSMNGISPLGRSRILTPKDGSSWADINGEDAYDLSGWSVSLSADGNIVAIGAT